MTLFEIAKPTSNYLVLESYISEQHSKNEAQQKSLHVVNLIDQEVSIGRGNDNEIRVNDISVSRIHAYIKRDPKDGSFYIEDN